MELSKTVGMMNSGDYKERFRAEYFQLKNRTLGLAGMLDKWAKGTLEFCPTAPKRIYDSQLDIMNRYLKILEKRAEIDGISLEEPRETTQDPNPSCNLDIVEE